MLPKCIAFVIMDNKYIGGGLATIALGGGSIASGTIFQGLILGVSRNPSLRAQLFTLAILGFSLAEAVSLLSLMVCFLILFAL